MKRMTVGRVKWFNDSKGYGFIESEDGIDVFVHFSVMQTCGINTLNPGQEVSYELLETRKGRQAAQIVVAEPEPQTVV